MDKFILITGGTKGIGKAVASCLGKAGYNLILTYASDQATAEEVRSELVGRFDIQVSILRADISDRNTIGVIDSFLPAISFSRMFRSTVSISSCIGAGTSAMSS